MLHVASKLHGVFRSDSSLTEVVKVNVVEMIFCKRASYSLKTVWSLCYVSSDCMAQLYICDLTHWSAYMSSVHNARKILLSAS